MLTQEQIDFFLVKAYNAALRAGARILEIYNDGTDIEVNLKSDHTPITLADRDSHTLIKSYLGPTHIPLLSEEGRDLLFEERCSWDLFWMVDPLDGTKEFIKGNGEFTVNIALMYNNRPEIGVIYVPYIQRMYFAVRGKGAFLQKQVAPDPQAERSLEQLLENRMPLPVRSGGNDPIRIALSRSHNTGETLERAGAVKRRFPSAVMIRQGSSYKLCMIAEASVDIYLRTTSTSEWDTAAGDVIIREAGGRIETFDGRALDYNKQSLRNPHFVCKNKYWRD